MKKIFIILTFFFTIHSLHAELMSSFEDNIAVRAGLSITRIKLQTDYLDTNDHHEDGNETMGYGVTTSVSKRLSHFEVGVFSDVYFGNLDELTFRIDNNEIRGTGYFRMMAVGPFIKFPTPWVYYNRWNPYVSVATSWSLHTFVFNNFLNQTSFSTKKRISFENSGISLNIGIEETLPYKEMHPSFFEIGYSYTDSYQMYVIDASDFKDVTTLSTNKSREFSGHCIHFRFGITLF